MEPVRLVPLPSPAREASVAVDGDWIVVERLAVADPALAGFLASRHASERVAVVERALRIGLIALQDTGVSVNVDVVRREFEALLRQTQLANERAAAALDGTLRLHFADGDGRLPRTLERFLGDRGQLRAFVQELFDESKRDSAIGRMRHLLGTYFDGDASRLSQLLDPTRLGSPLHQFRAEVNDGFGRLHERLAAIEAAASARGVERQRSAAKGTDFEDLLATALAEFVRGTGDLLDRTSDEPGAVLRSKKGDFVLTIDPGICRGADVRIVIEAKDRALSVRAIREELREAKQNRSAQVAMVVFTPAHAPAGVAPFDVRAGDVYCVLDPEAPDYAVLQGALRLARLVALASLAERDVEVDAAAISAALAGVRHQLELVRALKSQLTSIGSSAKDVANGLDRLRDAVLGCLADAEAELRVVRRQT